MASSPKSNDLKKNSSPSLTKHTTNGSLDSLKNTAVKTVGDKSPKSSGGKTDIKSPKSNNIAQPKIVRSPSSKSISSPSKTANKMSATTSVKNGSANAAGDNASKAVDEVLTNGKGVVEKVENGVVDSKPEVEKIDKKDESVEVVKENGISQPEGEKKVNGTLPEGEKKVNGTEEKKKIVTNGTNGAVEKDSCNGEKEAEVEIKPEAPVVKTESKVSDVVNESFQSNGNGLASQDSSFAETVIHVEEPVIENGKSVVGDEAEEPQVVTKQSIRFKVWEHLEKNDLILFPRPCKGRIPNFKGAPNAADVLIKQDIFKNSKTIKVNPDKPQELVRFHTLEYGKRLLVPVPRLRNGLFMAVIPPAESNKYQLKSASQRFGMNKFGKLVSTLDKTPIDLIVLGSVAVDKKGHRIGKGEGYGDLEFSMMVRMNAVTEQTVIATTVHDDQVYDELPEHLFKEHDVPVDWIITPTQVIEINNKLPRPKGIFWNLLSNRRILEIPILQSLREQDLEAGEECTLKEIDSDPEEKPTNPIVFKKRYIRRPPYSNYSRATGDPIRDSRMQTTDRRGGRNYQRGYYYAQPYGNTRGRYSEPPNRFRDDSRAPNVYRDDSRPRYNNRSGNGPPRSQWNRSRSEPDPRYRRSQANPRRDNGDNQENDGGRKPRDDDSNEPRESRPRRPRNRYSDNRQRSENRNEIESGKVVEQTTQEKGKKKPRTFVKRHRPAIDFSVRVFNLSPEVRVRELKDALNERGVKPRDITWRGFRGLAFLHFVKPQKNPDKTITIDDVINSLQGLSLKAKRTKSGVDKPIIVEEAKKKIAPVENNNKEVTKIITPPAVEATVELSIEKIVATENGALENY